MRAHKQTQKISLAFALSLVSSPFFFLLLLLQNPRFELFFILPSLSLSLLWLVNFFKGERESGNCLATQGKFVAPMVYLRRSKRFRLLDGTNILLPISAFAENGTLLPNYSQYSKLTSVHPINSDETKQLENSIEVREEQNNCQVEGSFDQVLPLKRRKRHKRKNVQNQEPCTMRGVYFKNMKWQAAIKVDKKQIHLGTVGSQEEAARLYDRAAFKCGREPNFELAEDEKKELGKYSWDEFLAMTRRAITHKKGRRRVGTGFSKNSKASMMENDDSDNDLSGSEDAEQEISS